MLLLLAHDCEAKFQTALLRLSGRKRPSHWKYLSKFGYGSGVGTFKLRIKLHAPRTIEEDVALRLELYMDDDWAQVEKLGDKCEQNLAMRTTNIIVNRTGDWGEWLEGTVERNDKPHITYFALQDCDVAFRNQTHRVRFEFQSAQEDGSEFSVEMQSILSANLIYLVFYSVFFWTFFKNVRVFFQNTGSVHPVIITLAVGVVIQYVAQVMHTVHLFMYKQNGHGLKALEVFAEILVVLSQVTMSSLLILISLGYTLLQSKIGELDLMIPLCFIIGVFHVFMVTFSKVKDESSYKYHENEGVIGWILLLVRMLIYAWFLYGVRSSAAESGRALKLFLGKFRFSGSIYFLSAPAMFLLTQCFPAYWQYSVMALGSMAMQMGSSVWLATTFLTRGEYFKVSTLSASELPGGTKVGVVKAE